MQYQEFIERKNTAVVNSGFICNDLNQSLYPFQRDIVRWALQKGKAAIFADCGLGKTLMQLEWARQVCMHTGGAVLVVAPLAVAAQTKREGAQFGINTVVCESADDVQNGINITNYEKLDKFDCSVFSGVVLDESSILKSFTGKLRGKIIDAFCRAPYRLACTATPAPNDYMELGNHAEFLGIMTREEMLSMYFVHDGGDTSKWRLKGHAEDVFWQWLGSWSIVMSNPCDLGYEAAGYDLPALNIREVIVDGGTPVRGNLSLTERRRARKESIELRCQYAASLVNASSEQWLVWCDLNDESKRLAELIPDAIEVTGQDRTEHKRDAMLDFAAGAERCLVTKPKIAGFGMNWQGCHNIVFTGLSDSYEQFYQAVRRCWRFGQVHDVNVYIVISAKEGCVLENINRKQQDSETMKAAMAAYTKEITKQELQKTCRITTPYEPQIRMQLPDWSEFIA